MRSIIWLSHNQVALSQVVLSKTIKRPLMGVFLGFKMHSLQKYIKHKYTHLTFFLSLLFFMIFESREDIIKKTLSFLSMKFYHS